MFNEEFRNKAAKVACRQLGLKIDAAFADVAKGPSNRFFTDVIMCPTGNEQGLGRCMNTGAPSSCSRN